MNTTTHYSGNTSEYNYSLKGEYKWIQLLLTDGIQMNTTTPYSENTSEYNYSLQGEYKWIQLLITARIQVNTTTPYSGNTSFSIHFAILLFRAIRQVLLKSWHSISVGKIQNKSTLLVYAKLFYFDCETSIFSLM